MSTTNDNMGQRYRECCKNHEHLGGKVDGCQEFHENPVETLTCLVCGCHRGFHRKVSEYKTEVVYTKCHRVRDLKLPNSFDGCQEYSGYLAVSTACQNCQCLKGFHRNEITKELN